MTNQFNISRILLYYDLPEIFIATDVLGTKYLALHVFSNKEITKHILTPISNARLLMFLGGEEDLKSIFEAPEQRLFFEVDNLSDTSFSGSIANYSEVPYEYLPDEGFYMESEFIHNEDVIQQEVTARERAIIHLNLVDSRNRHKIDVDILAEFLKSFQDFIKYSFKKSIQNLSPTEKQKRDQPYNYTVSLFDTSPGSFNLHLESNSDKDIFGETEIERALTILDKVTTEISDKEEYIMSLSEIKGYAINNFKKLLNTIKDNNYTFNYKWYSPGASHVHSRRIDPGYASQAIEIITSKEELTTETIELTGTFRKIDIDKGTWRITESTENKEYKGSTENLNILKDVTAGSVEYKLTCEKTIEQRMVSGKEIEKIVLISLSEL